MLVRKPILFTDFKFLFKIVIFLGPLLYVEADDKDSVQKFKMNLRQGNIQDGSLLDFISNSMLSMIGDLISLLIDQTGRWFGLLTARTETYLGSMQQRFNFTEAFQSIGFIKAMSYLVEDTSFYISEATQNFSSFQFNVMAPNNNLTSNFNFNFQEVD